MISNSNTAQQDAANRQNLSLIEESLMKHEEHSAELDDLRNQLEKANKLNAKLSAKVVYMFVLILFVVYIIVCLYS